MKVLWFVNVPFPALQHYLGISFSGGGGWMLALANLLCRDSSVKLGLATRCFTPGRLVEFETEGIKYFAFSHRYESTFCDRRLFLRPVRIVDSFLRSSDRRTLEYCHDIVERFQPDLIHVHGSEEAWGLIAANCNVPTVISMQGILNGSLPVYWGSCPAVWRIVLHREVKYWLEWRFRRTPREREVFLANRNFLGRTYWDRAWQRALQPAGRYWHVEELLRSEFYETKWRLDRAERFALCTTTSGTPLKGTDVLIRALGLLRHRYPRVRLRIIGELPDHGWGGYLRRLVRDLGLEKHVSFLGFLDPHQIADQLHRAHVYVLPSHIENSPNALCEAQLVGVPCIASCVGGVPSLVEQGRTGLLFPKGDHVALAGMVSQLFDDDEVSDVLGANAYAVAQSRHDPAKVIQDLLRAYSEAVDSSRNTP